jgi:hypothetical protein
MPGQSGGIGKVRIGQPAQVLIAECGLPLHAQPRTKLRVVAQFGMGIQRQVIGKQIDVMRQQQTDALLEPARDAPSMPRQNRPWCTKMASAPASIAASIRARLAVTPLTMRRISLLPSTCRPLGP